MSNTKRCDCLIDVVSLLIRSHATKPKKVKNPSTGVVEFVGRYLHVGSVSHSCVTVGELASANGQATDKQTWTKIYEHLILCRIGNKYVGELIIET